MLQTCAGSRVIFDQPCTGDLAGYVRVMCTSIRPNLKIHVVIRGCQSQVPARVRASGKMMHPE
eukprot:6461838-Pyramimonas_sp.AAC.1